jgi:hypothetical protein
MRGQDAIVIVDKLISSADIGVKVFKNERPNNFEGKEYIVINQLSFPQEGRPVKNGYLNVNIHVKDAPNGEPYSGRINEITDLVIPLFREETDAEENRYTKREGIYFSFDDDGGLFADKDETHCQNLRIEVTYNN